MTVSPADSDPATPNLEDAYADVCRQRDLLQSEIALLRTDLKKARAERDAHRKHAEDVHVELARLRAALVGAQAELAVVLGSASARGYTGLEPLRTHADVDKELRDNLSTMIVLFDRMRAKMDGLERERGALARERDAAVAAKEAVAAEFGALKGRVGREKAKLKELLQGMKEPKLVNDGDSIADRGSIYRRPTTLVSPPSQSGYRPITRPRCESVHTSSTISPPTRTRALSTNTKGKTREPSEAQSHKPRKENPWHVEGVEDAYTAAAVAIEEAGAKHSRKASAVNGSSAKSRRTQDSNEHANTVRIYNRRPSVQRLSQSQTHTHHVRKSSHAAVAS